jgi:hypothetical protein
MNREVHVRICGGLGLKCPGLPGVVVSVEGKGIRLRCQVGIRKTVRSPRVGWGSLVMCRYKA